MDIGQPANLTGKVRSKNTSIISPSSIAPSTSTTPKIALAPMLWWPCAIAIWCPTFCVLVHHIDEFNSPYLQACQQRSILQVDRCFSVSQHWQQQLTVEFDVTAFPVTNGVNLQRFSPVLSGRESELKASLGIENSPVFLTVGGIEPRKNSIRLLQAFALVLEQYPRAQLAIAGGRLCLITRTIASSFLMR